METTKSGEYIPTLPIQICVQLSISQEEQASVMTSVNVQTGHLFFHSFMVTFSVEPKS